jgi:hypothetical protein
VPGRSGERLIRGPTMTFCRRPWPANKLGCSLGGMAWPRLPLRARKHREQFQGNLLSEPRASMTARRWTENGTGRSREPLRGLPGEGQRATPFCQVPVDDDENACLSEHESNESSFESNLLSERV